MQPSVLLFLEMRQLIFLIQDNLLCVLGELISTLETCNIDKYMMRGQGYDGAACMGRVIRGTRSYIQSQVPEAIYVHCAAHSLNLAISETCTHQSIRNCLGTVEKNIHIFQHSEKTTCFTKHAEYKYRKYCTFETSSAVCYKMGAEVLCEMLETTKKLRLDLFYFVVLSCNHNFCFLFTPWRVYKVIAFLSAKFCSPQASTYLQLCRQQKMQVSHKWELTMEMPRTSSRQKNCDNSPATNREEYYRRTLFIPFCDNFINHLEERFVNNKKLLTSFACLVPTGNSPTKFYKNNLQDKYEGVLTAELMLWYIKFNKKGSDVPRSAISLLNDCNKDIYPNVNIALKIFVTLPVTIATPEHSFSTLQCLETYLRSTMGHGRLADLAAVNIYRQINISSEEVIDMLHKTGRRHLELVQQA
ncbi:hypothetical protein PR048_014614, partial [Dryococelus australis]